MTDLTELKDGWGEPDPPMPAARTAARAALMREMTTSTTIRESRRHGRRFGWLVGGTVVVAAAAAVAVVLSPAQPPPSPGEQQAKPAPTVPLDEMSGQQVLRLAAGVAETRPEDTGVAWHVFEESAMKEYPVSLIHQWTTREGVHYAMNEGDPGARLYVLNKGFFVGGRELSLERVQNMPTDPDKLVEWLSEGYVRDNYVPTPEEMAGRIPFAMANLLYEVPTPPAVRSAALRALAEMPNVTNLGAVEGGQALKVVFEEMPADKWAPGERPPDTGQMTMVIDPGTATLVSITTYQGTRKILSAGWTHDLPKIIPEK
jgi:hypothetical protein